MQNWIIAHALALLGVTTLGGALAAVVKFALHDEETVVEAVIEKLLNDPKWGPKLIENREQIEEFFDNLDKGVTAGFQKKP